MSLRRLLTRCLLLTVLFYTVVGTPLHEAGHVKQWAAALAHGSTQASDAQGTAIADIDGDNGNDSDDGEARHDVCLWCLAQAHQAVGATFSAPFPAPPGRAEAPRPRPAQAFVADPDHWPFAARDPPHALS